MFCATEERLIVPKMHFIEGKDRLKRVVSVLIAVLMLLFFSFPFKSLAGSYTNVTVSEAKGMIDSDFSLVTLDVRTQSEYDSGHIGNAELIPVTELEGRLDELNTTDEILVYCRSGVRSATASQILADNGFKYVYNMLGGIIAWIDAGHPVYVKYSSIQEAINNADEGDKIFVSSGTYYGNVVVNKTVSLTGEYKETTIIEGSGIGTGISIIADHVTVQEFWIRNYEVGIKVDSNSNVISSNLVSSNGYDETELLTDQEIHQDYVSPTHRWYLHDLVNSSYTAFFGITEHTPAISVQALGHEDINQLGIGLFHDGNGDHEPQLQEYVSYGDAKEQNVHVFLINPPMGQYIIKVLGWEVPGETGHFDLEITRYTGYGIVFLSSRNNTITGNLVTHNPVGLYLHDSYDTTIQLNDAIENVGGIVLSDSAECVISNNNASRNEFGSGIRQFGNGMTFWSVHDFYISENSVSSNTFGIWLLNSSDNEVIENGLVSNLAWGLVLYDSHDNTVHDNDIFTNGDGIRMMFSCQNNFTENHFESNGHAGIFLWLDNDNNSITKNKFYSNTQHGVELKFSDNNTIADNEIAFNSNNGILIIESTGCTVTRNHVFSNSKGIMFYDAFGNKVYRNNIIDSWDQQGADVRSANFWDNGYEGNYWSNYNGMDLDGNGIGDTELPWEDVDHYPLMNPYWNPGDVDHDLDVDLYDAVRLLKAYGSKLGDKEYNCHCDINEPYGVINLYDAVLLLMNYGKKYS